MVVYKSGWLMQYCCRVLLTGVLCMNAVVAAPVDVSSIPFIQGAKGKVVLLDFWASWCGPCRKSFPWMNAMQKKYADRGLTVIAVNLDMDRQLATEFLQAVPAQFYIEYDAGGKLATQFGVSAMPTSFVLDRTGRIVKQHAGFREEQMAAREAELVQLLKE